MVGGREERQKCKKRFGRRSFARSRNGPALLGNVANGFGNAQCVMAITRIEEAGAGCGGPGFLWQSHLHSWRQGDRARRHECRIRMERFGRSESHFAWGIRNSAAGER